MSCIELDQSTECIKRQWQQELRLNSGGTAVFCLVSSVVDLLRFACLCLMHLGLCCSLWFYCCKSMVKTWKKTNINLKLMTFFYMPLNRQYFIGYLVILIKFLILQLTLANQRLGSPSWRWCWKLETFFIFPGDSFTRETASQIHTPFTSLSPLTRKTAGETCWWRFAIYNPKHVNYHCYCVITELC